MTQLDTLLEANHAYAASHVPAPGPRPAHQLAVVTCMDTRIDGLAELGLHLGDAHLLRNAGGRVTDDVLRSLSVSTHVLGVDSVVVVQHTKCGLVGVTDDEMRARTGAAIDFLAIREHAAVLNQDVERIAETPYLTAIASIAGLVYDVETGRLSDVVRWQRPG